MLAAYGATILTFRANLRAYFCIGVDAAGSLPYAYELNELRLHSVLLGEQTVCYTMYST